MRVAIQGEPGSFHHIAASHWFEPETSYVAGATFGEVFDALGDGQADQAVVAIENSDYGSINEVYDLLAHHPYPIVGELSERVRQQLVGHEGATLGGITAVVSHPVALAQVSGFLQSVLPRAERVEYHDTAAAIEHVKRLGDPTIAAVGSHLAAELAGLAILRSGIENERQNYTRFLVIDPSGQPPAYADKSSLILRTSHEPGALYKALGVFAASSINLTKLQSRPIPGKVWKYQFYVDVETAGQPLATAVEALKQQDCRVTVLGEYQRAAEVYED